MVNAVVKRAYSDIKNLRVQGATNIAIRALVALKSVKDRKELSAAASLLSEARPTEPLMRNGLRFVAHHAQNYDFKKQVSLWSDRYIQLCENALHKLAEIGAKRIVNNSTIMTHCHSSAVTAVLKKARDQHKEFQVYVCEARPRYQGRITAKELANHCIEVDYIVDSARASFIQDTDLVLVGADALTAEGSIVNKIGTADLAVLADRAGVEFGVASELLKFDPITAQGVAEPIEERDYREVWDKPPKGVTVRNPAFDTTGAELIDFIITEDGVLSPHNILSMASEKYPWLKR
jgi:ribose 1,5-bisphosphate isomerase